MLCAFSNLSAQLAYICCLTFMAHQALAQQQRPTGSAASGINSSGPTDSFESNKESSKISGERSGHKSGEESSDEPRAYAIRPAPDSLSGHLAVALKIGYLAPLANAEQRFSHQSYIRPGANVGVDLGIGISRYVSVVGRFDYAFLFPARSCESQDSCKATSMSLGLGAQYHIVDGASIDPWVRIGMGYRITHYDLTLNGVDISRRYQGLDWLHLALGADWFASSKFGFGPYMHLDLGTYHKRPSTPPPNSEEPVGTSVHVILATGLRLVISPMR